MTVNERRKYLALVRQRYKVAGRAERGQLLEEMEAVTGLHRKSLIRLMAAPTLVRQPRRGGRGRKYGPDVGRMVRLVWETLDYVCAERLKPALPSTARQLARFEEIDLTPEVAALLAEISVSTVQRFIRRLPRRDRPRLPRKGPAEANQWRRRVPMGRLEWCLEVPGHFEADLVQHSGPVAEGEYAYTLQLIDIATGWSERVALLGRSQRAMGVAMRRVLQRLPFAMLRLHPDNGSEFFNNNLLRLLGREVTGLQLMRSRPYHKNDNRFVEQKNYTLVRAYLGHERFDTPGQVAALNELYEQMWIYYNLFQPVMRLRQKQFDDGKLRRCWDQAATPFQRLMATGALSAEQQARLQRLYDANNPRQLRLEIYDALRHLPTTASGPDTAARAG